MDNTKKDWKLPAGYKFPLFPSNTFSYKLTKNILFFIYTKNCNLNLNFNYIIGFTLRCSFHKSIYYDHKDVELISNYKSKLKITFSKHSFKGNRCFYICWCRFEITKKNSSHLKDYFLILAWNFINFILAKNFNFL